MKWKLDGFLVGMVAAVVVAWALPDPGADGGALRPEILTKAGVSLIFFLHGLALSFASLRAGVMRWPLHGVIQSLTFVAFPLLGLLLLKAFGGLFSPDLGLGFFFLCALPSTVSSSIAMTAAARGNVPVAVFNATLSSLLGIVLTPLWIGLVASTGGAAFSIGAVIVDLVVWLLLPLLAGQLARPWLGEWAAGHGNWIRFADRGTILLLVYTSFANSVKQGVWTGTDLVALLPAGVGSLLLFVLVFWAARLACRRLRVPKADEIAVIFCGTKKTLASGIPMAHLIFAGHPGLGLILLPIMIYHTLQLFICGWLAARWARQPEGASF